MGFLLDTDVISETVRPRPDAGLLSWFASQRAADMYLAAITMGELVRGACRLQDENRRRALEQWIYQDLARQFTGRILPFDHDAAVLWGQIMGRNDRLGRPRAAADAQIAAVARRHDLTVVTRNDRDFTSMDVAMIDPWSGTRTP